MRGDVKTYAVDQWIDHRDQSEVPGPFIESKLFEQDETNVVNSTFMTGAAYAIAPDKFKSKISNKTIIRIEIPLTKTSILTPRSSSLHYLNPVSGGFDLIANEQVYVSGSSNDHFMNETAPRWLDSVPFTPYGFTHSPVNEVQEAFYRVPELAQLFNQYVPDGNSNLDLRSRKLTSYTASFINARHAANNSQSIDLSRYISHPFLLEKAVLEFPVQAGPGWMNDAFQWYVNLPNLTPTSERGDCGGPMVTAFLARQDGNANGFRDLIASATFTNARDSLTASYNVTTCSYNVGTYRAYYVSRVGLSGTVNPHVVLKGASSPYSSSLNFYTGSVKLTMEPAVTNHVARFDISGSVAGTLFNIDVDNKSRTNIGAPWAFGFPTRRPGQLSSGRNVYGNGIVPFSAEDIDSRRNPVKSYERDYEELVSVDPWASPYYTLMKLYTDVVSKTNSSPYLLYPNDKLVVGLNKYRSVANGIFMYDPPGLDLLGYPNDKHRIVTGVLAVHDIKIPTGTLYLTLYGDLLKEDREFHDTLNQRLETLELWETIGEEPVLDQFDVTYASELSGSFIDRFNVKKVMNSIGLAVPTSLSTEQYYSNFTGNGNASWTTQYDWTNTRKIYELQKSARGVIHNSTDEIFWDTRIPNPKECMLACNANYQLVNYSPGLPVWYNVVATGNDFYRPVVNSLIYADVGIRDWGMTYPYESRYANVTQKFSNTLKSDAQPSVGGAAFGMVGDHIPYETINIQVGITNARIVIGEGSGYTTGLTMPEFLKTFYGIGDGVSPIDNQHVIPRSMLGSIVAWKGVDIRGWRHGMMSAFQTNPSTIFRRNHFGHFRDMFEQRLDAKFYDSKTGAKEGPVQVKFYDAKGKFTDPLRTLSSNLSYEATSSVPYTDGVARNRTAFDLSNLNITTVAISN